MAAKEQSVYLPLARKWRPQQFSEVLGQDQITATLINAVKQKRLSHAYLFAGPRGIGKTTLARILAKAVNCLSSESPTPRPCDKCDSCREIMAGSSLDVLEIDGASNTGVDDVRELRENVKYAPARGRYKIYIIDEVHMLSISAFNALLKTLEEPPPRIMFLFATTEPQKLPPTIISRCQRFDLRKIPRGAVLERLKKIAKNEGVACEEEALLTVASCADGSMRDAESIFDQLLVFCDKKIRQQDVLALLGLVPREVLRKFSRAIGEGKPGEVIALVNDVFNQGWSVPQLIASLLRHFRDLLVLSLSEQPGEMVEVSAELLPEYREESRGFTHPQLMFILEELVRLERGIKFAVSDRIALEMTLLKLARSPSRVYIEDLIRRCEELEGPSGSVPETAPPPETRKDPPSPPVGNDPPSGTLEQVEKIWPEFLETLGRERSLLKTYLHEGRPREFAGGVLTVCFDEEFDFHREALLAPAKVAFLENLLKNKLGFPVKLKFAVASGKGAASCAPTAPEVADPKAKKKLVNQNPVVRSAIEMFDATVVDIKD